MFNLSISSGVSSLSFSKQLIGIFAPVRQSTLGRPQFRPYTYKLAASRDW
ncbi:MAG: hypothetical protein JOY90_18985 [Bradyrhizobium sp.]|nr:hypothetical protein [Bradyrhizobium sp.]MBV9562503.1 hypothetical protein [Bradyrhizobium sp.]